MGNLFSCNSTLRLFVAIMPDSEALENIHAIIKTWKKEAWSHDIRWLPKETIHLTLRFLGNTSQSQLEALSRLFTDVSHIVSPFEMNLGKPIFLPKPSNTRVVALTVKPCASLETLANTIEQVARGQGYESEKRPFMAHITLGRCRNIDMRGHEALKTCDNILVKVTKIDLIKSTLLPQGYSYTSLGSFALKNINTG